MRTASFVAIVDALNKADVPYLVVGGMAVIIHGYGRTTRDVDLVIQLTERVVLAAFDALAKIGYLPRVPITAVDFANPEKRAEWVRDKGMMVLNFFSDAHTETMLDVFISEPFDFVDEHRSAHLEEVAPGVTASFLRLTSLLTMKRAAGRLQDLADVDELTLGRPELR